MRITRFTAVATTMLTAYACGSGPTEPTCEELGNCTVSLAVRVDVSALLTVDQVVVEVTAPDITTPLAFNLAIANGVASGTVRVPTGTNRTFTVTAFDTGGVATHRGSIQAAVTEGSNLTITLTLNALQGDQPLEAHIGSIIVDVEPEANSINVGDTVRLLAVVMDASNATLNVQVRWATLNPALAWVDTAGLVTANAPGQVQIVGTYGGVGDAVTVTIPAQGSGFALDFSGSAQVIVPDHADLDLGATWTIEAWIKPRNVAGGFEHLVSKWGSCDVASYSLELNASMLRNGIASCANGTQVTASNPVLVNGVWQHVAVTLSQGTLRLFINGSLAAQTTGSLQPLATITAVTFGRQSGGGLQYDGLLDEIRIWQVSRTETQLQTTMHTKLNGTEAGLVGYWPFDEGTGDVAGDATGRGHNGQLGTAAGVDVSDPAWTTDVPPVN